jgi:predicted Mrr-cat superfamily restriction endonuclease
MGRVWGIRAGKRGEAHELFLEDRVVALADAELGDLSKLQTSREAFYIAYRKKHPNDTRTGSAGIGGKFFRFMHEVSVGNLVVYPALRTRTIYVGVVTSGYAFRKGSAFPHRRSVEWRFEIPKSEFSLSARYELGAARTFFEFRKNVKELLAKIGSKSVTRLHSSEKVN